MVNNYKACYLLKVLLYSDSTIDDGDGGGGDNDYVMTMMN